MEEPLKISMYRFSILALALTTLGLAPQLCADSFHKHGSLNFEHQNINEENHRDSFSNLSSNQDNKDNGNFNLDSNDQGDREDIDSSPGQTPLSTPEPAVF